VVVLYSMVSIENSFDRPKYDRSDE